MHDKTTTERKMGPVDEPSRRVIIIQSDGQLSMMRKLMIVIMTEEHPLNVCGRLIVPLLDFDAELNSKGLPENADRSRDNGYLHLV
jgi:hypothetical protein